VIAGDVVEDAELSLAILGRRQEIRRLHVHALAHEVDLRSAQVAGRDLPPIDHEPAESRVLDQLPVVLGGHLQMSLAHEAIRRTRTVDRVRVNHTVQRYDVSQPV